MSLNSAVEAVLFAALDKPTAAERNDYLDSACAGDADLRRQVEKLLHAHVHVGDFLNQPVVERLAASAAESGCTQAFDTAPDRQQPAPERTEGGAEDEDASALSFLSPSTRPDALGRLGHYEVLQVLGRGGFGIVLRAFDEVLQRVVAIKVLAPALAVTSPARKRFLREARSSAQVRHENVVQVYAVEDQPLPYLVMEFIPGETLQQRLDRTGPLDVADTLRIGRQIAEGLAAAHEHGLIHRDIKPANVLLESDARGHVKLTDFGLARAADDASLTQSGVVAGTPMYMSPEQATGDKLDHRADLFSLGSVLYVMATGRPPFRAATTYAVLKRVVEDTPRPIQEVIPEVPPWLCALIARLQSKKPAERCSSAREVAELLSIADCRLQIADSRRGGRTVPSSSANPQSAIRNPQWTRWLAVAAVLLLCLGGIGLTEANGVTNMRGTAIRLFAPEGTLEIQVDDPAVSVQLDGEDLVITGAGAREIRLKPGRYLVVARKDSAVVHRELITVAKDGRQIVRVSQVADGGRKQEDALPAERQVALLPGWLKERNPAFDGQVDSKVEGGAIVGITIRGNVTDLSPLRTLVGLKTLTVSGCPQLKDLDPLRGMKLTTLDIGGWVGDHSAVRELSPLTGMPLTSLNLRANPVEDLAPLTGMPLTSLELGLTKVRDLSPLRGMKLTALYLHNCTELRDLSPLKGMPLTTLHLGGWMATPVRDLTPLKGMPLTSLSIEASGITDLTPLQALPLENFSLTQRIITQGLEVIRGMKSLKTIALFGPGLGEKEPWPAAEFWQRFDKGEFKE